ncbi:MAG: metallophosphoesterase [Deltaproteobacteria bacterium]|nr:metallophosphoesterase [Deltaproteobacteria bacterium]
MSKSPDGSATEAPKTGTCSLEIHGSEGWSERAKVPCPKDGTVSFLLSGDIGLPTEILGMTVRASMDWCSTNECDLGLLPGDVLYDDGARAATYWPVIWDGGFSHLGIPFALVLGNHEYRHEPNSPKKRAVLLEADGREGLISPGPSYALRLLGPDGEALVAIAAVDTDSVSNPIPSMPGLGEDALTAACGTGAPVVWVGHHPPSSQGLHHTHEAHVETALRARLSKLVADGCKVATATAGHDHDLQAYGPGCESEGTPGVIVAGPGSKGFRPPGPTHLSPCPADSDAVSRYFAGPRLTGGFAWFTVKGTDAGGTVEVKLVEATADGSVVKSTDSWTF